MHPFLSVCPVEKSRTGWFCGLYFLGLLTLSADDQPTVTPDPNTPRLSAENIQLFDHYGYFSVEFKAKIKRLVELQQELAAVKAEKNQLQDSLPEKDTLAKAAVTKTAALRAQWDGYTGQEDRLFSELQDELKNSAASSAEHLSTIQAYLWSYPNSPHLAELQQDLQQTQKEIADQAVADKNAEIARQAARAALMTRMEARRLSLDEWNSFLSKLSQDEVIRYLGRPPIVGSDYWIYTGGWVIDPVTQRSANLQVSFNGTRVLTATTSPLEQ